MRRRRRLAVRARDDDRAAQRDELGEELSARPAAGAARVRGRDHRLPAVADDRLGRDLHLHAAEPPRGTASRHGPSLPPRHPTRGRANAYADSPAPPIPTNQICLPSSGGKRDQLLGDLVRGVRPRHRQHRLPHAREPLWVAEQLGDERRVRARARSRARRRAPPPRSKWRAFSVWWSPVACG